MDRAFDKLNSRNPTGKGYKQLLRQQYGSLYFKTQLIITSDDNKWKEKTTFNS